MILLIELFYCFMIIMTGVFCFSWFYMRRNIEWRGRVWLAWVVNTLALMCGGYHVLFGLCKLFYTLASAPELLT